MMKKFYLLCFLMLLPLMASADESGSCGENVTWTYVEASQELIISGSGPMTDFGYSTPWKSYKTVIQTVEISEGVTSIGNRAFYECEALTTVTIPNGVIAIGSSAFEYCKALTSVAIPNSVTTIGVRAFGACGLTSITIPSSVISIGDGAFGRNPFTSIHVDEGNQSYLAEDDILFTKDKSTILVYSSKKADKSYTIPSSVTTIGVCAFYGATLTTVIIPNSVTTIGEDAFTVSRITSITIPSSVTSINGSAFNYNHLSSIDVEEGNLNYIANDGVLFDKNMSTLICYPTKKEVSSYTIPNSVTTIAGHAFTNSNNLSSVIFPNGLTSIGDYSFNQCKNLISVDIPNSVTSIGVRAFLSCSAMTSLTLGSGVTSIGTSCFNSCKQLKDFYCHAVNVPKTSSSITNISLEEITLHVPAASLETYKATEPWSKFGKIVAIENSSEGEPSAAPNPYVIWCADNTTLYFTGSGDDISAGTYKGHTITNMWYGETVTKSPENPESYAYKPMPWSGYFKDCSKVVFEESFKDVRVTSTSAWFSGCNMQSIEGIEYLNTSEVTSMNCMFGCPNLTSLDVSHFDTRNVKYMQGMFSGCKKLQTIDLSHFDTSNVLDMFSMFERCQALKTIDLSSFETSKVTNMSWMFKECTALESLDITNFNTANVTLTNMMFQSCSSLKSLDLTKLNTEKVTEMGWMFYDCSSLTALDLTHFNTSNVTYMGGMFSGCSGLTSLDVSHFNTSKVTNMGGMFARCPGLTSLNLSNFDTRNVTDMSGMFSESSGLTTLNITSFNTGNVTTMEGMFQGCSSLTSLDLSSFNTANVTDMLYMFNNCSNLTTIYASDNWSVAKVEDFGGFEVFVNCTKLVGGQGTTYDEYQTSVIYARIDGGRPDPAYFTEKNTTDNKDVDEITIKETGKTTWCSEYDLDFTNVAGIKAYTATGYDDIDKTIWLTRVMKVPAGTGLMIKGDAGTYKVPHANVRAYYTNMLVGNLGDQIEIEETDGDMTNYYLKGGTFLSVNGSAKIGKNKAYLQLPTRVFAGTRTIGISYDDEEDTTGLKEVKNEGVKSNEWYTLQGQRVEKPDKGIYIKNGRKVVIK